MEPSQTSEGDAGRQTSISFLEKLEDVRSDGEEDQAQNNTNVSTSIFHNLSFGQNDEGLLSIEVNQPKKVKAVGAIKTGAALREVPPLTETGINWIFFLATQKPQ